ncbi:PH domain-containing protein [Fodinicola feengrottensis]|uniref:PH domain-containing protein n=1 Tax=Fodinicola feengrottensis TaxID=435914 RepID=A0ABN2GDF9_9ACTN|nr:PH domain-containing protein [Fodinicola feengrottensis]
MRFPERLLVEDERVVLHLHPHWKTLTPAVLVLLATVGVASYGIGALRYPSLQVLIALAAIAFIGWFSGRRVVRWLTTHVVFTSERIIVRVGLFKRHRWELPLADITDVAYASSILGRMLRCGTLVVRAGTEDGESGQLTLVDLPRARDVQTILYELMEEEEKRAAEEEDEEEFDDDIPDFGNFRPSSPVVKLDQPE